jgi:hypothetical protein
LRYRRTRREPAKEVRLPYLAWGFMSYGRKQGWSAILTLGLALASVAEAKELNFRHVMDIGSEGTEPGQFKYVEDYCLRQER